MRGLTILIAIGDRARFRAALSLATAQAALGGRVRLMCQEEAVGLLADRPDPDATRLAATGLADIPTLVEAAIEMGVSLIACQSGLAAHALAPEALFAGTESGGVVGLLATLDEDRLVMV